MLQFHQTYEIWLSLFKSEPYKRNKISYQAPFDNCDRSEDNKIA
jgi:hypothetical protein